MIAQTLEVNRSLFEQRTGWELKPQGACKGEHCIPLASPIEGDTVDLSDMAEQLNLPLVHDEAQGLWALGPESIGSHALATVEAPNLRLPTLEGEMFELRSLRGKKVVLVAWSPY